MPGHQQTARHRAVYKISHSSFITHLTHYNDVIMGAIASQITSLTIVHSTIYSGADQRKQQSPASLVFVRGIHRGPVNSPHKWPVTRKMFPFDDVSCVNHFQTFLEEMVTIMSAASQPWKLLDNANIFYVSKINLRTTRVYTKKIMLERKYWLSISPRTQTSLWIQEINPKST